MSVSAARYLMKYLPEDYQKSAEVIEIQEGIGGVWLEIKTDIEELKAQLDIETATWGLVFWEMDYGIETDLSKDYGARRSMIKAKRRGTGTTTVAMIKNTAESFVNGEVDIEEHNEEYYFNVIMVGITGIPPNLEDLKKAIEEIKPAHLDYTIIIKYNTWGMVEDSGMTWAEAEERTWAEMKEVAL